MSSKFNKKTENTHSLPDMFIVSTLSWLTDEQRNKLSEKTSDGSSTTAFAEQMRLFTEFKGALTENFVYQSLIRSFEVPPRYWAEAPHEVDFIIQFENDIIPVEAKAGESVKAASMKRYIKDYDAETQMAVRLSMKNLSYDGKVLNVPLFMIDELKRLILTIERK